MTIIIFLVIFIFVVYIIKNHVIIRIDTFFRKGFKKMTDKYGVYCWVGKQGDGKTYSAIDYIKDIKPKKVITNVKSFADNNKDYVIYEANFYEIINKFESGEYTTDYIIFYDELFTLLEKGKLNKNILTFISQLRKRGIYLITTVQEWLDINVTFRRYVRYQIDCSMINLPIFNCAICINSIHDGYQMKWNNDINEYEAPIIKTMIKKCSKAVADSYDTFETIATT